MKTCSKERLIMIGVCIKYFHENYGGMLQAFATVRMLEARNIDYELIQYEKKRTLIEKIRSIPRLFNRVLLNDKYEALKKKNGLKKHPEFAKKDAIRMQAFARFKEKSFTKFSPAFVGYKELCKGAERYDAVVTGSDQLWSPAGLPTNFYNLMFVPEHIRKISYASSFGVSNIPWYQRKRTAQFLKRLDYISMREIRGSEIVKELTGREVPTILDPVFSFSKDEWNKLIPQKKLYDAPYIFAYFLGANPAHREAVKQLSAKTGLKIVALRHMDQYVDEDEMFGDYAPYDVGPEEFLNYLREAEYVCTDSFHGSCFSIINEKKFMIFNRYDEQSTTSKNSRIDSLCSSLGLSERRYRGNVLDIEKEIDYKMVKSKFAKIYSKTEKYLDQAFEGV